MERRGGGVNIELPAWACKARISAAAPSVACSMQLPPVASSGSALVHLVGGFRFAVPRKRGKRKNEVLRCFCMQGGRVNMHTGLFWGARCPGGVQTSLSPEFPPRQGTRADAAAGSVQNAALEPTIFKDFGFFG